MLISSIWLTDRILSGATTLTQSGPGSESNESLFRIPQSSSIIENLLSDCWVSYQETSWWEVSYPSAEMQSIYSSAPADWAAIS